MENAKDLFTKENHKFNHSKDKVLEALGITQEFVGMEPEEFLANGFKKALEKISTHLASISFRSLGQLNGIIPDNMVPEELKSVKELSFSYEEKLSLTTVVCLKNYEDIHAYAMFCFKPEDYAKIENSKSRMIEA